jgi:hypothetical protein
MHYILYTTQPDPKQTDMFMHTMTCLYCTGIEPVIRQLFLRQAACLTSTLLKLEWVLTTANAAGTNGLPCLPTYGGARDNKFLVTHPMTDQCCLAFAIVHRAHWPQGHQAPHWSDIMVSHLFLRWPSTMTLASLNNGWVLKVNYNNHCVTSVLNLSFHLIVRKAKIARSKIIDVCNLNQLPCDFVV